MVRDLIEKYQLEEDKSFDYVYAIHDHNDRTHTSLYSGFFIEDLIQIIHKFCLLRKDIIFSLILGLRPPRYFASLLSNIHTV
jgi:hypothetical protein